MGNIFLKINLFYLLMFTTLNVISAQTIDLQTIPNDKIQFGINFNKAFYASHTEMSALSGVYQLYVNIPVSSKLNIICDIPYLNTSYDINYGFSQFSYTQNGFGNIFVGFQTKPKIPDNRRSIFTLGLFLPTAAEQASVNGVLADYYNFSKYLPNTFGFYFNYAYHHINTEGFNYGLELGPNLLIPTKSNNSETEFFAHYGIIAGYQINKLLLNLEIVGIVVISQDIDNFGDRFINMLNIGAQWKGAIVTPKVFYKIYLRNEIRHNVDGVLGIGVNISIN